MFAMRCSAHGGFYTTNTRSLGLGCGLFVVTQTLPPLTQGTRAANINVRARLLLR
jgi:hypothetical protein